MNKKLIKDNIKHPLAIFLTAFILRLAYLIFLKQNYFFYDYPASDVLYYQEWAKEISRHSFIGFKTFYGLPLYPYFLAFLDRIFLGQEILIRLLHLMIGSLNCVLVYFIGDRCFSKKCGTLASLLTATNSTLIYYDWLMMPVPVLIFLSLLIVYSLINIEQLQSSREYFILGILLGLAVLGDGKMLLFAFYVSLHQLFIKHQLKVRAFLKSFGLVLSGLIIILFLCGFRNYIAGGSWVWISAQKGLSFYVGNNPEANGMYEHPTFLRPSHAGQDADQKIIAELSSNRKLTDKEVSQFWENKGYFFIKTMPKEYILLLGKKFALFFTESELAYDIDLLLQKNWIKRFDFNPLALMFPLGLLGMWLYRKSNDGYLLNAVIASQLLMTIFFFLTHRHRATIYPYLILYESFALCWIFENTRAKNFKPIGISLLLIFGFFILFPKQKMDLKRVEFLRASRSGHVYENKKNYSEAQKQYFKALSIKPNTNTYYNLGNSYALQGQCEEAITYYQKVLSAHTFHIDALYNTAFCLEQLGNIPTALVYYTILLNYQPDSPDVHFRMGSIYQNHGDCSKAVFHYRQVISLNPIFTSHIEPLIAQCSGS